MAIDPVSSSISSASDTNASAQIRNNLKALASALGQGDLSSAQSAFASLEKSVPGGTTSSSSSSPSPWNDLSSALQSGDLASAQKAFAEIQSSHKGHHRHHSAPPPPPSNDTTASGSTADTGDSSLGNSLNTTA